MSAETLSDLNRAIANHMAEEFGEDAKLITHWTVVAAGFDSDGKPRIMRDDCAEEMPVWQTRGLLEEAIVGLSVLDES